MFGSSGTVFLLHILLWNVLLSWYFWHTFLTENCTELLCINFHCLKEVTVVLVPPSLHVCLLTIAILYIIISRYMKFYRQSCKSLLRCWLCKNQPQSVQKKKLPKKRFLLHGYPNTICFIINVVFYLLVHSCIKKKYYYHEVNHIGISISVLRILFFIYYFLIFYSSKIRSCSRRLSSSSEFFGRLDQHR